MKLIQEIIITHMQFYDTQEGNKGFQPLSQVTDFLNRTQQQLAVLTQQIDQIKLRTTDIKARFEQQYPDLDPL